MKMNRENGTAGARSSGDLLVVTLILMVLSCVLFVGTTLAWFSDQTSGSIHRIQAGNLEAVLMLGEDGYTAVKLDTPAGAQPVNGENTAVSLRMHKLIVTRDGEDTVTDVTVSDAETEVWNPDEIFISDLMQVVKASGSVPFRYELALLLDPETQEPPGAEESGGPEEPTVTLRAGDMIDFRIVDADTISSLSTGESPTRAYDYDSIAAYFSDAAEPEPPVPIWPLAEAESGGQETDPANVFSSELGEDEAPVRFVVLARLKPGAVLTAEDPNTIDNPFNLVVTVRQGEAGLPAGEAGDAP